MKKGNDTISSIFKGSKAIDKIMKGTLVVYEAFKKLIASGVPPITLEKCKGVDLVDYKIYGNTMEIISKKNLFNINSDEIENGYLNNKGVFTTPHANLYTTGYIPLDSNQTSITISYIQSGLQTMESPSTCFYDKDKNFISGVPFNTANPKIINIPEGAVYLRTCFREYYTDYQIEYGETATEYEPYSEIKSVGEKTKNIMPINNNCSATMRGLSLTIENDVLTLDGTLSTNIQFGLYLDNGKLNIHTKGVIGIENDTPNLMILNAGTYIMSFKYLGGTYEREDESVNPGYYGLYTYKNGVKLLDDRRTLRMSDYSSKLTLTEETEAQFFVIQFTANNNPITFNNYQFKIQLEESSTPTEYEPYGYKIPVTVRGKNYFDLSKVKITPATSGFKTAEVSENGIIARQKYAHTSAQYNFIVEKDMTVTFSYEANSTENYRPYVWFIIDGKIYYDVSSGKVFNLTAGNNVVIHFAWNTYVSGYTITYEEEVTFTNIRLEEVEPITTNIYIDEPLKEGEYISYSENNLPNIPLNKGTNIIEIDTDVMPSYMEFKYYGKGQLEKLEETENIVLNDILGTDTETELDITDSEINQILDEIIGG